MAQVSDKKLCGLFGRDDGVRHVNTQMINWHGPTGTVFSVDIQPFKVGRKRRVATGGSDSNVQLWELKNDEQEVGCVEHISQLSRHDCAVNVVRFHPSDDILASASDDRCLFVWRLDTSNAEGAPNIFADDKTEQVENAENWTVIKQIRGHGSEVYDIAWSPDATAILSVTMDNTAYVWNTESCRKLATLQHHKGYVQGAAWDPCNKLVTTVSSDRSAIVYNTGKFEPLQRISKIKSAAKGSERIVTPNKSVMASDRCGEMMDIFPETHKTTVETLKTMVETHNTTVEAHNTIAETHNTTAGTHNCAVETHNTTAETHNATAGIHNSSKIGKDLKIFLDTGMVDTFFRRPGFSPDGKLVAYPCGCYEVENTESLSDNTEDAMVQINVVYVYQVNNLESPALCLPTGNSPAIAVRFCPQMFALRPKSPSHSHLFNLPYRMIYAVITLDNVLLYDSQQQAPFACIASIHYEQLTDASWSSDGGYLIVSSIDGFCTIITLDIERLGLPYRASQECITSPASCGERIENEQTWTIVDQSPASTQLSAC